MNYMIKDKKENTIVKYFASLDKREKKIRLKTDPLIKGGMIEMIKKEIDKKTEVTKKNNFELE